MTSPQPRAPSRLHALAAAIVAVCAIAPIASAAVDVWDGWVPAGDTAILAIRARDVLTGDTPLLGQPSTAGASTGEQVHHPGPLELWVIGLGQRVVDDPRASLVVVALVNVAAVLTCWWWLRRLSPTAGTLLTGTVLTVLVWSLRDEIVVEPFNPYAAVLPLAALLVSLVAAPSRPWALVTAALFGSWAAQAHLATTGPVAAATLAALVATGARAWLRHRSAERPTGDVAATRWRAPAVAAAVLAVCWAGPVLDALTRDGGNVSALLGTSGSVEPVPDGFSTSLDVAVTATAWPPAWSRHDLDAAALLAPPGGGDVAVVATIGLVGAAAAVALRRRHPEVGWAFGGAVVVLAAGTLLLSRLPDSFFAVFAPGNYLWLRPTSALLWGAVAAGVGALVAQRTTRRWPGGAAVALACAVSVGLAVHSVADPAASVTRRSDRTRVRALAEQVAPRLDPTRTYGLALPTGIHEQSVAAGLLAELIRRGFDVRVQEAFAPGLGEHRATGLEGTAGVLLVQVGRERPEAPQPAARLVGAYRPPQRLVAEMVEAERDVVERITGAGGVSRIAHPALGLGRRDPGALVRDGFAELAEGGFLADGVEDWEETRRLLAARAAPTRHATVHLLPTP